MKYLKKYDELGLSTSDDIFEYMMGSLKPSNTIWSYFVNWEKVVKNTNKIEVGLNILNYLIGKENFDAEFRSLLKEQPEVAEIIPSLIVRNGSNDKKFTILTEIKNRELIYEEFDFTKKDISDDDIEKYLQFVERTGLKDIIVNKNVKNLVDYMLGVEAGLDSNGRKNRGGHSMEGIVEEFIKDLCSRHNLRYLKEANADKIKNELGYDVPVDRSSRRYDFVIDNGKKLFLIETNFYGGGGSKLKSTAGEYQNLQNILNNSQHSLIWITDGKGWRSTKRPLHETFENNDFLFTLRLLEHGVLDEVVALP